MRKNENCPASRNISELERYIQYLDDITKDIEESRRLPEKLKETLCLSLTPICGYKSKKYNSVLTDINNVQPDVIVAQSNITGLQKTVDNTKFICDRYIKIIDGLIKYTRRRINKLKKETQPKQK